MANCHPKSDSWPASQPPKKTKIAVIGAGLADLTAALRLCQKNHEVTVYEARNRVGGRILKAYYPIQNYTNKTHRTV